MGKITTGSASYKLFLDSYAGDTSDLYADDLDQFVRRLESRSESMVVKVERYETDNGSPGFRHHVWQRAKISLVHDSGRQYHVRAYYNGSWSLSGALDTDKVLARGDMRVVKQLIEERKERFAHTPR